MVITYFNSKGKNQPGKVANPARGQLNMYGHTYSNSKDQSGKVANPSRG